MKQHSSTCGTPSSTGQLVDSYRRMIDRVIDDLPSDVAPGDALRLLAEAASARMALATSPAQAATALRPLVRRLSKGTYLPF